MAEIQQENGTNKRVIPPWFIILVLLLLGFALFGDRGVIVVYKAYLQKTDMEAKIAELEKTNEELRQQIDDLHNNLKAIENIARRELGMVRPDEQVYQFHPETVKEMPPIPVGENGEGPKPESGRVDTDSGGG